MAHPVENVAVLHVHRPGGADGKAGGRRTAVALCDLGEGPVRDVDLDEVVARARLVPAVEVAERVEADVRYLGVHQRANRSDDGRRARRLIHRVERGEAEVVAGRTGDGVHLAGRRMNGDPGDRKSTRLNSSHTV